MENHDKNRNQILRKAADEFSEKTGKLSTSLEIAIVGSVAGNDPYPNDLDLALVIANLSEITKIARYARQISKYYHGWEVFLFDKSMGFLGRICHRKRCPAQSIDCVPGVCGRIAHVKEDPGFEYDERIFLSSPVEIIYTNSRESLLLSHKHKLGITGSREYSPLKDIKIKCVICGKIFLFTAGEQKWYQKRGYNQPKRCSKCRDEMYLDNY